jgi:predicted Zn finger-like uncharacterized protein
MKVQCGQCPAKYAVSDERIQDKKVRIHCKRCGASIVVDGKVNPPLITSTPARRSVRPTSTVPPETPPPPSPAEREPDSRPSPRPVAHTIMGGLEAPAAERLQRPRSTPPPRPPRNPSGTTPDPPRVGMPAMHRGLTDPPRGADETRWRVALTKQDLRWMTTEEIVDAYQAGAVKLETFVFRTGMPTWVTLLEVPEIAEALSGKGEEGSSLASLLPPSPSSLPPPRKGLARDEADDETEAEAESFAEDDPELNETVPFQLVAERASGPRDGAAAPPADGGAGAPVEAPLPAALEGADQRDPASPGLGAGEEVPAAVPFAAAQRTSGSSPWIWVVAVVLALAAAAALLAPRFGMKFL